MRDSGRRLIVVTCRGVDDDSTAQVSVDVVGDDDDDDDDALLRSN